MISTKPQNTAQQIMGSFKIGSGDNWDELANGQEEKIKAIIAESSVGIKNATDDVQAAGLIDEEFSTMVRGTMNDLREFATRYQVLVERRGGRTGPTKNDQDYTEYMNLGLEYVGLDQEMSVVLPMGLVGLAEYQGRARRILEEKDLEKAQDVNVITDVQVKEPKPEIQEIEVPTTPEQAAE